MGVMAFYYLQKYFPFDILQYVMQRLKAPYSPKLDILLSKKGLTNWYIVLIES